MGLAAGLLFLASRLQNLNSLTKMKKNPADQRDWHEKRIEEGRRPTPPASNQREPDRAQEKSNAEKPSGDETNELRVKRPGEAGLGNEVRPGLGSRGKAAGSTDDFSGESNASETDQDKPKATPRGYEEPRPEPREQPPDSFAHEEERSTGVSGQTSGD